MAAERSRPVYHPAGHDNELRAAVQDLRTGRWLSMRNLLAETLDWTMWTQRTQVLATVAGAPTPYRHGVPRSPGASPRS